MTSGVDELEAFIAALRLSFITSSTVAGSPEGLRQGIAAFRETLRPGSTLATSSTLTEGYAPKQNDVHDSGSSVLAQAGEPISSTSTVWSCDDRADVPSQLTKQIELVSTEVREGTSQIRELIQSMNELKMEVRDLRSALAAPKLVASNEDPTLPSTLSRREVVDCASPPSVYKSQVDPAPNQSSGIASGSPLLLTAACLQPLSTVTPSKPAPASRSSSAQTPTLPPALLHSLSSAPRAEADLGPFYPPTAVPVYPVCPSEPISPVTADLLETAFPASADTTLASSSGRIDYCICQTSAEETVAKETKCKICVPNDGGKLEAEAQSSRASLSRPRSHITVTVIQAHFTCNEGEIDLEEGAKIKVLDSPDTPEGWMYGEIAETRRGIFPARYVKQIQNSEVHKVLNGDDGMDNAEITEPSPESTVIRVSVSSFSTAKSGELRFGTGKRITVLDSPNTPVGWLYGEIVEKRRGLFLARYVALDEDESLGERSCM